MYIIDSNVFYIINGNVFTMLILLIQIDEENP